MSNPTAERKAPMRAVVGTTVANGHRYVVLSCGHYLVLHERENVTKRAIRCGDCRP